MMYCYFLGDFGVLVSDSGYPLRRFLLTPFLAPETEAEEKYNKAQILTHVKVECCFGILKNRFRSLLIPLRVMGPEKSSKVITAMMVLHNLAIQHRDLFEPLPEGLIMQPGNINGDNTNEAGQTARDYYIQNYFS